ncbi:MAG TPA: hypothetical protein VFL99_03015 [Segeticoccus sp.]|uniref:hypothetical protein n=1 Tax=Segeticoccus sp. TaxID=2706531 RepID=UPI002D7EE414|nr:hypothetical protein [Segeticoccus sp.]HET8599270.1 hypothetical protein [Segeticoccus sp.]
MSPQQYPIRRAPSFAAFIGTGAVLGFVIGALVSVFGPPTPDYSSGSTLLFIGVACAVVGALIAGALAVALDHRSVKKWERLQQLAERSTHTD